MKNLVVVESPSKIKTISKYLGNDYNVVASYGHVRDLKNKSGSIDTENSFSMIWEVSSNGKKQLTNIKKILSSSEKLILATDPDREGEAIAWHIVEEVTKQKKLQDKSIERVTFNEITKNAIKSAFSNPRKLNKNLINSYLGRRALDYLVGFTLSPVLWRKLPGAKSAGRVQSVALRLICEREIEIEKFEKKEYWNIFSNFKTVKGNFDAKLVEYDGEILEKFTLNNEKNTISSLELLKKQKYDIRNIKKEKRTRKPYAPFITSTLQQDAFSKLRFNTSKTMQVAQKLYEGINLKGESVGLITYMRTDSTHISMDNIPYIRNVISKKFGDEYLPKSFNVFKKKAANSQEAHEAIRPTNVSLLPAEVKKYLDDDAYRLYRLIWNRTVACQMQVAKFDQTTIDVVSGDGLHKFRASGQVIVFDGFLKVYNTNVDDEKNEKLPVVDENTSINDFKLDSKQSFTMPPPRYTEASIVKKMEEIGIGRPSTYATIIKILQARNYVSVESRKFIPNDNGRILTSFLTDYFSKWFDYEFTASLEDELDKISNGDLNYKEMLNNFWISFHEKVEEMSKSDPAEIRKKLDQTLGSHFFKGKDARNCKSCKDGRLMLNFGKYGNYISCSNYPECKYSLSLSARNEAESDQVFPKILGDIDGFSLSIKRGPYGFYLELETDKKPKRISLPKGEKIDDIDFERAKKFLAVQREIGIYPDNNKMITTGIGPFGPYLKLDGKFYSLKKDDVLEIGINRAVEVIAEEIKRKENSVKNLGKHPKLDEEIVLTAGRYGPYFKCGKKNFKIPKSYNFDEITFDNAIEIIGDAKASAKKPSKKATSKKATSKKVTSKKTTSKK